MPSTNKMKNFTRICNTTAFIVGGASAEGYCEYTPLRFAPRKVQENTPLIPHRRHRRKRLWGHVVENNTLVLAIYKCIFEHNIMAQLQVVDANQARNAWTQRQQQKILNCDIRHETVSHLGNNNIIQGYYYKLMFVWAGAPPKVLFASVLLFGIPKPPQPDDNVCVPKKCNIPMRRTHFVRKLEAEHQLLFGAKLTQYPARVMDYKLISQRRTTKLTSTAEF